MKNIRLLFWYGIMFLITMAPGPLRITYQAVLRTSNGAVLANQPAVVKASVLIGDPNDESVFSEAHSVVSSNTGIISLTIGSGQPIMGTIDAVNWKSGLAYLKIEIDYNNSGSYILVGVSQILSVPYAIQSGNSLVQLGGSDGQIISHDGNVWLANDKVWVKTTGVVIDGIETEDPLNAIFSIQNSAGESLFNVNQQGVEVRLMDDGENKGVLEVTGILSQNKYLTLSPDSAKLQFNTNNVKAEKGGFAVGGLSNGKSITTPYFMVEPAEIQLNFDKMAAVKSEKGGFAIGGLSNGKLVSYLFTIEPDSTRMFIDTTLAKSEKGGFAIGGLSNGKPISEEYFRLTNVGANLKFDETAGRSEKGGFAIGGLSNSKFGAYDYFQLSELKTQVSMFDNGGKEGIGGMAIGGYIQNGPQFEPFFNLTLDSININTGNTTTGGGIVIGGDIGTGGTIIFRPQVETNFLAEYDSLAAVIYGSLLADGGGEVTAYGFVWNTIPNPTPKQNVGICLQETVEFGQFVCNLNNLDFATKYYIRAFATNSAGTSYGAEISFTTLSQTAIYPKAITLAPTEVTDVAAVMQGSIVNTADSTVLERGFVWNTVHNPTISNSLGTISDYLSESGAFSLEVTGLAPFTEYYVRAFVKHTDGVLYGAEESFTTLYMPVFSGTTLSTVTDIQAFATAAIDFADGVLVDSVGFIWSLTPNTSFQSMVDYTVHSSVEAGEFSDLISNLIPQTHYYIRAYAVQPHGILYGPETSVITSALPVVAGVSMSNIIDFEVIATSSVTFTPEVHVDSVGFIWGFDSELTIQSAIGYSSEGSVVAGSFSATITALNAASQYYIRAYAAHSTGIELGETNTFTTLVSPTITAESVIDISDISAEITALITVSSGFSVLELGFEYTTSTFEASFVDTLITSYTEGQTSINGSLIGLIPATEYSVRAFVQYNSGTIYGNTVTFTTQPSPSITTDSINAIGINSAIAYAFSTIPENTIASKIGFLWSTTDANPTFPTTTDSTQVETFSAGEFSDEIFELTAETHYYLRAFIENSIGYTYGEVLEFTTIGTARATTDSVTAVTPTTAEVFAHIEYPEGEIDTVGFEWSTYSDFAEVAGSTETAFNGDENFAFSITDLQPATIYYVRAFIAYNIGEVEGNPVYDYIKSDSIIIFGTLAPDFGLVTLPITDIHPVGFTGSGRIMQPEPFLPNEVGFVIAQSENPTFETNEVKQIITLDNPDYFESIFDGLTPEATYYLRIYTTYNDSVKYGEQQAITLPSVFGTVSDIDENIYNTKYIGKTNWTISNLRTIHYNDGTSIDPTHVISFWDTVIGIDTAKIFGKYYNGIAAYNFYDKEKSNQKLCPTGWRLPMPSDFEELISTAVSADSAKHVKDTAYQSLSPLSGLTPTNQTGFAAIASGVFAVEDGDTLNSLMFSDLYAMFYVSSSSLEKQGFIINGENMMFDNVFDDIDSLYCSVRCVQNFEKLPKIGTTITQEDPIGASAQILYNILSTGNAENGVQGLVWSYNDNPTLEYNEDYTEQRIRKGIITEVYESPLPFETPIYFRAYAKSDLGTVYSESIEIVLTEPNVSMETLPITVFGGNTFLAVGRFNNPDELSYDYVGFVINSEGNPTMETTIQDIKIYSIDMDVFDQAIDSLEALQTYYVRSYVKMGGYIKYGEVGSVTLPAINGTVTDIDNNEYPTKYIGLQNWMTVNLRVINYSDNTPITESEYVLPYWGADSLQRHGYLYSQKVVANHLLNNPSSTICPIGWRLPNPDDWWDLLENASHDFMLAGTYLKANDGWNGEVETNDSVGFSALPTGEYYFNDYGEGIDQEYYDYENYSYMWSEPELNGTEIYSDILDINRYSTEASLNSWSFFMEDNESDYLSIRCIKTGVMLPELDTWIEVDTSHTSFIITYDIFNTGNSANGERGIVWSTQPNPSYEINEGITTHQLLANSFTEIIEGIEQEVTYYTRAYAKNEAGIVYSNVKMFEASTTQSMFDIDRNKYPVVTIGEQDWMARNLRVTKYTNQEQIQEEGAYGFNMKYKEPFQGLESIDLYGYLYNINATANHLINSVSEKLCPVGWRIPEENDWTTLYSFIGGNADTLGRALKDTVISWPSDSATNSSGFTALPSGYGKYFNGEGWMFDYFDYDNSTRFWNEATEAAIGHEANLTIINGMTDDITQELYKPLENNDIIYAPVRCIKSVYTAPQIGTTLDVDSTRDALCVKFNVLSTGYFETGEQGAVISTNPDPTIETNQAHVTSHFQKGTGVAVFNGLLSETQYYVKAYVKNELGTVYSSQRAITTGVNYGLFDIQGNSYSSKLMDNQEWMTQNLRTIKFTNGKEVDAYVPTEIGFSDAFEYGLLYDFSAAAYHKTSKDATQLCPQGWRLPLMEDWTNLFDYAGETLETAFVELRTPSWPTPGTNSTGFSAIPAGYMVGSMVIPDLPVNVAKPTNKELTKDKYSPIAKGSMQGDGTYYGFGDMTQFWTEPAASPELSSEVLILENEIGIPEFAAYVPVRDPQLFSSVRCVKEGVRMPRLGSEVLYDTTATEIWLKFEVKSAGFTTTGTQGVVWNTTPNPTIETNLGIVSNPLVTDTAFIVITGLDPSTLYYVRTFAENEAGTVYSDEISVPTNNVMKVFDIEGNKYSTVIIGEQEWLLENLRTTRFANGEIIVEGFVPPEDGLDSLNPYGYFYLFNAISNHRTKTDEGICPNGWRLPETIDWNQLIASTGETAEFAGAHLKDTEIAWPLPTTNTTGFKAVPAGAFTMFWGEGMWIPNYLDKSTAAYFWTEPKGTNSNLTSQGINIEGFSDAIITNLYDPKTDPVLGASVRCIRSIPEAPEIGEIINTYTYPYSIRVDYEITVGLYSTIGSRGVVLSQTPNPTIDVNDVIISNYLERGSFSDVFEDLEENTTYYVRVFADNELGTVYSNDFVLTTEAYTTVTDYDGNVYQTRVIGGQEWMLSNLGNTHYNNGDEIHQDENTGFPQDPYIRDYPTPGNFAENFGALYGFPIAVDPRGICPEGWKIPHQDDWLELFDSLGGMAVAGGKLKSTDTGEEGYGGDGYWQFPNTGASDIALFNAKAAGYQGSSGYCYGLNTGDPMQARFWSSSLVDPENVNIFYLTHDSEEVFSSTEETIGGTYWASYSVRCVKIRPEKTYLSFVTTDEPSEISYTSITISGNLLFDGTQISELGFCYSLTTEPTISDTKINVGTNPDNFTATIEGLSLTTNYYIRAYAINPKGVSYGNEVFVTTLTATLPDIQTLGFTNKIYTAPMCKGEVVSEMGNPVTARGLVWSSSELPTVEVNQGISTEGAGAGEFETTLNELIPFNTYYLRAYATNSIGTSYGAEVVFVPYHFNGLGTSESPFLINDITDLTLITNNSDYWQPGLHFSQPVNIDASSTTAMNSGDGWLPIGFGDAYGFQGNYNGNGNSIDGLKIVRFMDTQGLFSLTYAATVRNLDLTNVDITSGTNTGALIGTNNFSIIKNCHVSGIINASDYSGGLIGSNNDSQVDSCSNSATVSCGHYSGGLIGSNSGNVISNCYNLGNVTGGDYLGGLIGRNMNSTINQCYSNAFIDGFQYYCGGLIGWAESSTIQKCYSKGSVDSESGVGGLIGDYSGNLTTDCYSSVSVVGVTNVGGFIGNEQSNSNIERCYSYGAVSGSSAVGGFVGNSAMNNIYGCFWDTEISMLETSDGGTGLPTIEMQDISQYYNDNWDFMNESYNGEDEIWGINPTVNGGRPFLAFEGYTHISPEYTVTSTAGFGGTITPNGSTLVSLGQAIEFDIQLEPFTDSFSLYLDGELDGEPGNPYYLEGIASNHTVEVTFQLAMFELIYNSESFGYIEGDTFQEVMYGQNASEVTAVPNEGYIFLKWSDERTDNPRTDFNITENLSVDAIFIPGVVDYDGNIYQTVNLGGYVWMTSNLKTTHDQNGDTITGWGYFNDIAENSNTYGLLYEWNNAENPCPVGFDFPSDYDWQQFEVNVLMMAPAVVPNTGWRGDVGGDLKDDSGLYWELPNTGGSNYHGFTALPGGEYINGTGYVQMGYEAHFWTSEESDATNAWYRKLSYDSNAIFRDVAPKTNRKSIRCVKFDF